MLYNFLLSLLILDGLVLTAVVLLQAGALGAANLAGKDAIFTSLMYAVTLLPIGAGLYIILMPSWRHPNRRSLAPAARTA